MIKNNTVLILGAGASCPYGFPTGQGLINNIVDNLTPKVKGGKNSNKFYQLIRSYYNDDEIDNFRDALRKSSFPSIDEFIHENLQFGQIGKAAIVQDIIKNEHENIFPDNESHWYKSLWQTLLEDREKLISLFDNLTILTYNYDRSLEYFLHRSLINSFTNMSEDTFSQVFNNFKIYHLYGKIADLPFQNPAKNKPFDYKDFGDYGNIIDLSQNIVLMHESFNNTKRIEMFDRILDAAKNIYFMGFGYHESNLNIIYSGIASNPHIPHIIGTAKGITPMRVEKICHFFKTKKGINISLLGEKDSDLTFFIENHTRLN